MEISGIQNVQHNVWVSPNFLKEIENVATKSTNGNRGTSEVVSQLGDFITYTIRFLQNIGNFAHTHPYIPYGNGLYGYVTESDDSNNGIGTISFRYLPDNIVYIEGISINLSNYSLLIEHSYQEVTKAILINESDLRLMIKECVTRILREQYKDNKFFGWKCVKKAYEEGGADDETLAHLKKSYDKYGEKCAKHGKSPNDSGFKRWTSRIDAKSCEMGKGWAFPDYGD